MKSALVGRLLAACALGVLSASQAQAQSVTSVSCDNNLSFGSFVAGAGTVTIDPATGSRSKTGMVVTPASFPDGDRATCNVVVSGAADYSLSFSSSTISFTSGANSMTANLTTSPTPKLTTTGTTGTFYVGGTLNVPSSSQPPGDYSGSYTVIVQFP